MFRAFDIFLNRKDLSKKLKNSVLAAKTQNFYENK